MIKLKFRHGANYALPSRSLTLVVGSSGSLKAAIWDAVRLGLAGKQKPNSEVLASGQTNGAIPRAVAIAPADPDTFLFCEYVEDEIYFGFENSGIDRLTILSLAWSLASDFGVEKFFGRSVATLSGGEKQLVLLASALGSPADVVLIDEPFANLDAVNRLHVISVLKNRALTMNKSIILFTGRIEEWMRTIDNVLAVDDTNSKLFPAPWDVQQVRSVARFDRHYHLSEHRVDALRDAWATIGATVQDLDYLQIDKLSFSFRGGEEPLFRSGDLKIPIDRPILVHGSNGSGKTTFAKILCGLVAGFGGSFSFVSNQTPKTQPLIVYGFQNAKVQFLTDSVWSEIALSLSGKFRCEATKQQLCRQLMDAFDLTNFAMEHPLSLTAYQQRLLTIATLLAMGASGIVLDEPTNGLDDWEKEAIVQVIDQISDLGAMMIVISHDNIGAKLKWPTITFENKAIHLSKEA